MAASTLQQQNWVVATETSGPLQKKFATLCFTKHFDKRFPGVVLKVCNLGKTDKSSCSTDEKTVCMVTCLESRDRTGPQLWAVFTHNYVQVFLILPYCIYPRDAFVVAKIKCTEKVKTILIEC